MVENKVKKSNETVPVMVRVPSKMYKMLEKEKENFSYPAVQSIVLEALRERYFKKTGKGKGGRPRDLNLMRVGSAKKVFE